MYHKPYLNSEFVSVEQREKRNEKSKKYYQNHRIEILEKKKEYRKTNQYKIHRKEYSSEYYKKNEDVLKTNSKIYRKTEKGKFVQSISSQKRKSRQKGLPVQFSKADWEKSLEFFEYKCAYCGKQENQLQKEHVIPTVKGGGYIKNNIVPSCLKCNYSKHTHDLEYWYPNYKWFDENKYKRIKKYIEGAY